MYSTNTFTKHLVILVMLFDCSYFFQVIHSYIPLDEDFITILIQLRTAYGTWLKQEKNQKYACVSKKQTLAGTLEEVCSYVIILHECVTTIH